MLLAVVLFYVNAVIIYVAKEIEVVEGKWKFKDKEHQKHNY